MQFQSGNAEETKEYTKHLPSGFVTHDEMKARLERKKNKVNASDQRENGKRKTPLALTHDKVETGQRRCESKKNGDDTMQFQSGNAEKTKEHTKHLPLGFVTHVEMKARLERKKNKVNASDQRENGKRKTPLALTHDKVETGQRRCESKKNGDDTITKGYNENRENKFFTGANESLKLMSKTEFCRTNSRTAKDMCKYRDFIFENSRDDENKSTCDSIRNNSISYRKSADSCKRKYSAQQIQASRHTVIYRRDVENDRDDVENDEDDGDKTLLEYLNLAVSFRGKPAPFKIIIMNVNGPSDTRGTVPERRRHTIQALILKYTPTLLLLQEFKWKDIRGKIWKACPIPDQYYYQGHSEASMIHDESLVTVADLSTEMRRVLEGLQRSSLNQLTAIFPLNFDPLSRMCSKLLRSRFEPSLSVICISWHGFHNGFDKKKKIEFFKYLIEFFRNIHIKMNLPILIGGDFNIAMQYVEECISQPFKLHKYIASKRRNKAGIIDFFITTNELHLTSTTFVDLEILDPESHPTDIFDHDPVYTVLSNEE